MSKVHQKVSGPVQRMLEAVQNTRSDIGDLAKEQFLIEKLLIAFAAAYADE